MKPYQLSLLRRLALGETSPICSDCSLRIRQISHHARSMQEAQLQPQPPKSASPKAKLAPATVAPPTAAIHSPRKTPLDLPVSPSGHFQHPGYIEPLGRPIGSHKTPHELDNSPLDTRTLKEKYRDATNWDKHLNRRAIIMSEMSKPYFRDWKNLTFERGKLWLGNERIWKRELSLFMPNLVGDRLDGQLFRGTTEVLKGKISLVAIFQREWARQQAETWYSPTSNPRLAQLLQTGQINLVSVNVEDAPLHRGIQNIFRWFIKRQQSVQERERYFFLKEIPLLIREEIGVLNSRVGYVYLVDEECRIRWAGCADANEEEKEVIYRGAERLVRMLGERKVKEGAAA